MHLHWEVLLAFFCFKTRHLQAFSDFIHFAYLALGGVFVSSRLATQHNLACIGRCSGVSIYNAAPHQIER